MHPAGLFDPISLAGTVAIKSTLFGLVPGTVTRVADADDSRIAIAFIVVTTGASAAVQPNGAASASAGYRVFNTNPPFVQTYRDYQNGIAVMYTATPLSGMLSLQVIEYVYDPDRARGINVLGGR